MLMIDQKKRFIVILITAVLLLVWAGLSCYAEEKKNEPTKEQIEMYKKWLSLTSPGEKHKHLQYFVGEWESVQKILQGEGKEPVTRHQDISVESLYEGRFTRAVIRFREKIMGMLAEGIVITGYDSYKKEFMSVTFGSLGTRFSINRGQLDESGKTRIDWGESENMFTGKKNNTKAVTLILGPDKYRYDYYDVDDQGKENKVMEIIYTRKK